MAPKSNYRRCHLFHDDGRPRKLVGGREGCHRGFYCWYIHPDDPLWKQLPPVYPPPREKLADDDPTPPPPPTSSSPSEPKTLRSAHSHSSHHRGSYSPPEPKHSRDTERPSHSRRSLSPPWFLSSSRSEDRMKWDDGTDIGTSHRRHEAPRGRRSRSHDSRPQDYNRREKYKGAVSFVASRTCNTPGSPPFTEYTASGPPTLDIPPSPRLGDVFLDTRNGVVWYFADDWVEWRGLSRSYAHPYHKDRFLVPGEDQFVWASIERHREARQKAEDLFGNDVSVIAIIDRYIDPPNRKKTVPEPPDVPVPTQPPAPLPASPAFLADPPNSVNIAEKPEPTIEEKRQMWTERIKLVSDCLNARTEHCKIEDEYQRLQRLRQSSRHADLSGPARNALEVQLADCQVRREQMKSEVSSTFTTLAESDLWPVLSPQQPEARAALARYRGLVETVGELQATMTKLDLSVKTHIAESQKHQEETSGNPEDASTRPTKRQNTQEAGPGEISSSGKADEDVGDLEERVVSLEGQLSNLMNSMAQQQNELFDEIQALLETKFDEMDFQPRHGDLSGNAEKLAELEREITTVGTQVEELAKDLENFRQRSSVQEVELTRLKERVQRLEALDAEREKQLLFYTEKQEKNKREVIAINAALQAYLDRPSSPAHIVPPELILRAIEDPLSSAVREDVGAMFLELRQHVEETIAERNAEVYDAVWSRLGLTFEMVETLAAYMERGQGRSIRVQ